LFITVKAITKNLKKAVMAVGLQRTQNLVISTLLFCTGQERNGPRISTHAHSHCSAYKTFCLASDVAVAVEAVVS